MPKVATTLNAKQLDAVIKSTIADIAFNGTKHNTRKAVGGVPAGLLIQITPVGSASWIMRTTTKGRRREIGLGSYPALSLSKAREQASEIASMVKGGNDPVAERRKGRARSQTFRECAESYIADNRDGWKSEKHAAQWESTLRNWAYTKIGNEPMQSIDKTMIADILRQPVTAADGKSLWAARHETAKRLRQRIESIFDYAKANDYFTGDNPAKWRGNLKPLMPALSKSTKRVKHHAALPYSDAPAFMSELKKRGGVAATALQFAILTAARSGEVRLATWDEIDLHNALWTLPDSRMKAGKEHTVPLCDAALSILQGVPQNERKGLMFPGAKVGKPMSDMTLAAVLKRMDRTGITVHGFRSTFRDWAGETTGHPRDVIENALAHQLKDKAEAAYARGNQLEKRKLLMAEWCEHLNADKNNGIS